MPVDAKKKRNFWWPAVDTLESASEAAKGGGVAFGFIVLGYVIAAAFAGAGIQWHMQPDAVNAKAVYVAVDLVIAAIAAFLAWRTSSDSV